MIVPTKFTPLDESALGKTPILLQAFDEPISVDRLYKLVGHQFEDVGEFLLSLDILYVLSSIRLDITAGIIEKC